MYLADEIVKGVGQPPSRARQFSETDIAVWFNTEFGALRSPMLSARRFAIDA